MQFNYQIHGLQVAGEYKNKRLFFDKILCTFDFSRLYLQPLRKVFSTISSKLFKYFRYLHTFQIYRIWQKKVIFISKVFFDGVFLSNLLKHMHSKLCRKKWYKNFKKRSSNKKGLKIIFWTLSLINNQLELPLFSKQFFYSFIIIIIL